MRFAADFVLLFWAVTSLRWTVYFAQATGTITGEQFSDLDISPTTPTLTVTSKTLTTAGDTFLELDDTIKSTVRTSMIVATAVNSVPEQDDTSISSVPSSMTLATAGDVFSKSNSSTISMIPPTSRNPFKESNDATTSEGLASIILDTKGDIFSELEHTTTSDGLASMIVKTADLFSEFDDTTTSDRLASMILDTKGEMFSHSDDINTSDEDTSTILATAAVLLSESEDITTSDGLASMIVKTADMFSEFDDTTTSDRLASMILDTKGEIFSHSDDINTSDEDTSTILATAAVLLSESEDITTSDGLASMIVDTTGDPLSESEDINTSSGLTSMFFATLGDLLSEIDDTSRANWLTSIILSSESENIITSNEFPSSVILATTGDLFSESEDVTTSDGLASMKVDSTGELITESEDINTSSGLTSMIFVTSGDLFSELDITANWLHSTILVSELQDIKSPNGLPSMVLATGEDLFSESEDSMISMISYDRSTSGLLSNSSSTTVVPTSVLPTAGGITSEMPTKLFPPSTKLNNTKAVENLAEEVNTIQNLTPSQLRNVSVIVANITDKALQNPKIAKSVFVLLDDISQSLPSNQETQPGARIPTVESTQRILATVQRVAQSLATPEGATVAGDNILLSAIRLDIQGGEGEANQTASNQTTRVRKEEPLSFVVNEDSRGTTILREALNWRAEEIRNSLSMPSSIVRKVSGQESVTVTSLVYLTDDLFIVSESNVATNTRLQDDPDLKEKVVSNVITGTITGSYGEVSVQTEEPIQIFLRTNEGKGDLIPVRQNCVFWNQSRWDTTGCELVRTEKDGVMCECYHLTSFAVLMTYRADDVPEDTNEVEHHLTLIGCALSIVGFFLTILSIALSGDLTNRKKRPAKIHICLFTMLALAFLLFVTAMGATHNPSGCYAVAVLLHYTLLSAFAWMTVEAYTIYKGVVQVLEPWPSRFLRWAALYAWGVPVIPVAVTAGVTGEAYRRPDICWISDVPLKYSFSTFVGLAILVNTTVFVIAMYKLFGSAGVVQSMRTNKIARSYQVKKLLMSMFLFILMGSTWVLGFFSTLDRTARVVQILFISFNATQGVFVFAFYFATNRQAAKMWARILCCKKSDYSVQGRTSSTSCKSLTQAKDVKYSDESRRPSVLTPTAETSFGTSSLSAKTSSTDLPTPGEENHAFSSDSDGS